MRTVFSSQTSAHEIIKEYGDASSSHVSSDHIVPIERTGENKSDYLEAMSLHAKANPQSAAKILHTYDSYGRALTEKVTAQEQDLHLRNRELAKSRSRAEYKNIAIVASISALLLTLGLLANQSIIRK